MAFQLWKERPEELTLDFATLQTTTFPEQIIIDAQ